MKKNTEEDHPQTNREKSQRTNKCVFYCRCDMNMVGKVGKCGVCGRRMNRKKRKG